MLKKIFSRENVKGALKESIETIVFVVVMVILGALSMLYLWILLCFTLR